jgi:O-antigen ligase
MSAIWLERLRRAEYLLLCGLALVLPIFETPKNLIIFLLLVTWIVHRAMKRDLVFRRPDLVEASLLFLLTATVLSTVANWPFANGPKGLKDIFVQCFLFWVIYRARFSEQQQVRLATWIVIGVMIGIPWGIADVFMGLRSQLQFHSAGIVTQSALYLGIVFVMTLSIAWHMANLSPAGASPWRARLWWAACTVMLGTLFLMGSRGPFAATILVTLLLVITARAKGLRWKGLMYMVLGLFLVGAAVSLALPGRFDQERAVLKTQEMLSGKLSSSDQERYDNWRIALRHIARSDDLVLGIGPRNYSAIDHTRMQFDPPLVIGSGHLKHAHNLFLTKLVEEGAAGLISLLFFFGVVAARLIRDFRQDTCGRWQWFAATGALGVPVLVGLVGTPWYQEHALLAMMLLAIYFGSERWAKPAS